MSIMRALKRRLSRFTQTSAERRHSLVGPPRLWKMKRDFQIQFLKAKGLAPDDYLLDIGCGTLRGGIPLITYLQTGRYYGIEARPEVLDEGRKELRQAGLEQKNPVLMLASETSQIGQEQKFDYVWAFSVLIHMSDAILRDTLALVNKHLSDTGVFYANVNIGERKDKNWQGFPAVWRPLEFYEQECAKAGLSVSDLGALRDLGHVSNDESQDSQRMLKIVKA